MNTEISALLGERIRSRRKELKLTQAAVCNGRITRNMLSCIENGSACPSVETLVYLADQLKMPVEYFLSKDSRNVSLYKRIEYINEIRKMFSTSQYKHCLDLCTQVDIKDAEILMIMAECKLHIARYCMDQCMLNSALKHLDECETHAKQGIYSKERYSATVKFYKTLINSVRNNEYPNFDEYRHTDVVLVEEEFLSFVYAISIISNSERVAKNTLPAFSNPVFNGYIDSIISINEYKFNDAIICLLDVLTRTDNFFVKYFTAKNLELCYKEIEDFKNAYEYAKMRLDLLDKFND